MNLVRAAARDYADNAAGRASVFGRVVAGLNLEFLDGLELRAHCIALVVIDAADIGLIEAAVEQIYILHAAVAEGRERLILVRGRHSARRHNRKLQIIAAVQRKLLYG